MATGLAAALLALLVAAAVLPTGGNRAADDTGVDADPGGSQVYRQHCAACHGRYLQGQALWQLSDRHARQRAPALDQTGHSWQLSDGQLLAVIRNGGGGDPGAGRVMPAFVATLDDREILAVIGFIKARWPLGLQVLQAMRNPGHAGMPSTVRHRNWIFPPDCR